MFQPQRGCACFADFSAGYVATALRLKNLSSSFPRVAEAATLGCVALPRWGSQNATTPEVHTIAKGWNEGTRHAFSA
jgi:hypothetical protein